MTARRFECFRGAAFGRHAAILWLCFALVGALIGCGLINDVEDGLTFPCRDVPASQPCPPLPGEGGGGAGGGPTTGGGPASSSSGGVACETAADCTTDTACVTASCDASQRCVTANASAGTPCSDDGGSVCDGIGNCVACNTVDDCGAQATACLVATDCIDHACVVDSAPQGTLCSDQGGHSCDGAGTCIGVVAIAPGSGHTCALTNLGGVKCWGSNFNGQLGDGTNTNSSTPVDVQGLTTGVVQISSGSSTSCAVTAAGGLWCWGVNSSGQLGDGTTTQSSTPVQVLGLSSGVAVVSSGGSHTCALTTADVVKCWGYNSYGELGDGTTMDQTSPVDVAYQPLNVVDVSAGSTHTCTLTATGSMHCWGYNYGGQLGNGGTTQEHTPDSVLTTGVEQMTTGYNHTCAVVLGAAAKCWGVNQNGAVGDGTTTNSSTPITLTGLSGVLAIEGGGAHTCALTTSGAYCWGRNSDGQLGDGTLIQKLSPVPVTGLGSGVATIVAGNAHTCATMTNGAAMCWGLNESGQLGDGTTIRRETPVPVVGF